MFGLIWAAVRSRTAQVLTVGILTCLAAAVAAAGPWFAAAAIDRAVAADLAAAPAAQRALSVRKIVDTRGDPQGTIRAFRRTVGEELAIPVSEPVDGLTQSVTAGDGESLALAYRDEVCRHLLLDGPCPAAPSEATISRDVAQRLRVAVGGTLELRGLFMAKAVPVKVVSTYAVREPAGPYWSNPLFTAGNGLDPVFTPVTTFEAEQLWEPTVSYDVQVPDALIRGAGGYRLGAELRAADLRLSQQQLRLVNATGPLLDTIARDRATIRRGLRVSTVQIVVLAWFAIGLAGRYTGRDRRADAALLKLRGSTRGATLRLAWGQHLVPLLLGGLAGLPLGFLLVRRLAGQQRFLGADLPYALGAVGAVVGGGLLVLAVLEALVLRRPVAVLLREVGGGRGDWRAGLADLLLLALAVATVYQARSGIPGTGLALAAPALVALAVALLLARLLGRLADRGGSAAVRAGRLRLGLTAVQVSRQPGAERLFALVVVAVAIFTTALGGWTGERTARTERSAAELGAARVLTVHAANRTALLQAVRRADPGGRQAMAVTVDRDSTPPVLAVDTARLAAVARWRPEFGPVDALAGGPPPPAVSAPVTGGRLTVRARYDSPVPADLTLALQHEGTGAVVRVPFGRLRPGAQSLDAPVTGCAAAPGCRILRWELTAPPLVAGGRAYAPPAGTGVTLLGLGQHEPDAVLLDAAALGDIARWRAGTTGAALDLTAGRAGLRLTVDDNTGGRAEVGDEAYPVDTALPLPVVLAGPPPEAWQFAEPVLSGLGAARVPVRITGTAPALPVLGREGVLVDLDATRRVIGDATVPGQFQVWLADTAGPGVVGALTAAGLTVTGDDTVTRRAGRLAVQGPAVTSRFALLAGVVALLFAAAALGVAGAVDRRSRWEQLSALRVQGLHRRVAVGTAYAGTMTLAAAGVLAGVLAAALARPLARLTIPPFTDGWQVLQPPGALGAVALPLATVTALAVLGLVGWLSVLPLIRSLRTEGRR
jgi:putative ABC transport system permease protein